MYKEIEMDEQSQQGALSRWKSLGGSSNPAAARSGGFPRVGVSGNNER